MIKVSKLSKKFQDLTVFQDIDLTVRTNEIVALIGPSGAGKSTFIRCLNGLEKPNAGSIRIEDTIWRAGMDKRQEKQAIKKIRSLTGMVFQSYQLFPHLTVMENLSMAPMLVKKMAKKEAERLGESLLHKVGLLDKKDDYPSRLSGGQKQRVAIARSLAMKPEIMLFDEPTSALDPELTGEVLNVIRQLAADGMTMVIVTHEMKFAEEIADRVIFMSDGKIQEEGDPAQFFANPQTDRARKFLRQIGH